MAESNPSVDDLAALQRQASALTAKADAVSHAYDRSAWFRYAAVFVPVPFTVLLFRLYLDAWGYYVAGALFILVAGVVFVRDSVAAARRDAAVQAAERARKACEDAQAAPGRVC